jgi:hypothetical protein
MRARHLQTKLIQRASSKNSTSMQMTSIKAPLVPAAIAMVGCVPLRRQMKDKAGEAMPTATAAEASRDENLPSAPSLQANSTLPRRFA